MYYQHFRTASDASQRGYSDKYSFGGGMTVFNKLSS